MRHYCCFAAMFQRPCDSGPSYISGSVTLRYYNTAKLYYDVVTMLCKQTDCPRELITVLNITVLPKASLLRQLVDLLALRKAKT